MRAKTKIVLAGSFVGVVAMAAAAFGQAGAGGDKERSQDQDQRRAAAAARDPDRCGPVHAGRRAARLVHSESKVTAPQGFADITIDHGKVTAVDHSSKKITIKRSDGETVTATAVDETTVCRDGKKVSFDSIKVGDLARLVQVRSERFTGLKRVAVFTPGSEPAAPQRSRERSGAPEGASDEKAG